MVIEHKLHKFELLNKVSGGVKCSGQLATYAVVGAAATGGYQGRRNPQCVFWVVAN